jgi:hypothetical protein
MRNFRGSISVGSSLELGILLRCARISPALPAGETPAPERGRAASPGIESWAHEGNDMS